MSCTSKRPLFSPTRPAPPPPPPPPNTRLIGRFGDEPSYAILVQTITNTQTYKAQDGAEESGDFVVVVVVAVALALVVGAFEVATVGCVEEDIEL